MRPDLAFVVTGAAAVDVAVALRRLERRREPFIERIDGLHIVVAVEQGGWFAGGVQPIGVNQRMALGIDEAGVLEADAGQLAEDEFGGAAAIGLVLGQGGNGRNAQQILEFVQKTGMVLACVGYGG